MVTPSLSERWHRVRKDFTLRDLLIDTSGKFLLGLGMGALLATRLVQYGWVLAVAGLALSFTVKAKHWKQFWA